jgi:hypothetical protein
VVTSISSPSWASALAYCAEPIAHDLLQWWLEQ